MPTQVVETATEWDAAGAVVPSPVLTWTVANTAIATATTPGVSSTITAQSVGSTTFHVADTSRGVVSPDYSILVQSSLGLVVLPSGVSLNGTLPALTNGGSGFGQLSVRVRFLVDALLGGTITASGLVNIGSAIEAGVNAVGGTLTFAGTMNGGVANAVFGTVAQSALPAAGTGVILYASYSGAGSGAGVITLETDAGTVLFTGTLTGSALGASGNTSGSIDTIAIGGGSSSAGGVTIDGAEIVGASITNPNTPPLPTDASAIGLWGFAGTLAPTGGLGPTLAPSSGSVTYLSGGVWN